MYTTHILLLLGMCAFHGTFSADVNMLLQELNTVKDQMAALQSTVNKMQVQLSKSL